MGGGREASAVSGLDEDPGSGPDADSRRQDQDLGKRVGLQRATARRTPLRPVAVSSTVRPIHRWSRCSREFVVLVTARPLRCKGCPRVADLHAVVLKPADLAVAQVDRRVRGDGCGPAHDVTGLGGHAWR